MWDPKIVDIEVARYAIRTFAVEDGQARSLTSHGYGIRGGWHKGVCEAHCGARSLFMSIARWEWVQHEAPELGCGCGVYGALSLESLRHQYPVYSNKLIAVIAAEGNTIIGPRGLRTQYARVVAWWSPFRMVETKSICRHDFPDATQYRRLKKMLKDYNIPERQPISNEEIATTWRGGYWA